MLLFKLLERETLLECIMLNAIALITMVYFVIVQTST